MSKTKMNKQKVASNVSQKLESILTHFKQTFFF